MTRPRFRRRGFLPAGLLRAGAGAAVAGVVADRLLEGSFAARRIAGWTRPNYRSAPVSLSGGAAAAFGTLVGAAVVGSPYRAPALVAGLSAALAGGYDDLLAARSEHRQDKGWRGHVRALRSGRISGGAVKVVVIGAGALAAAGPAARGHPAVARQDAGSRRGGRGGPGRPRARTSPVSTSPVSGAAGRARIGAVLPNAALIAGTANLLNLFDLRPGRAGKVALAVALLASRGPAGSLSAAVAGATAASLPGDLSERRMLGDLGANTLGAVLGVRLASARPAVRNGALAAVLVLTAVSERVSFSAVIDATPVLRTVDRWGRRPLDADSSR